MRRRRRPTQQRRRRNALFVPLVRLIWIGMQPQRALHVPWDTLRRLDLRPARRVLLGMQTWIPTLPRRAGVASLGTCHRPTVLCATSARLAKWTMTRMLPRCAKTVMLDRTRHQPEHHASHVLWAQHRWKQQPSALSASEARLAHDNCSHDAARHCQSQGIGVALSPNALAMTVMATRAVAKAPKMLSRCCFSKTAFVLFGTYRNGSCSDRQRQQHHAAAAK